MIHRRELLLVGAGVLAAKATASALACASDGPPSGGEDGATKKAPPPAGGDDHAGHEDHGDHGGHEDHGDGGGASATGAAAMVELAAKCVQVGNVCLAHCLRKLADGDKSMGECGRTVTEMLPVCEMIGVLAAAGSEHLPTAAKLCHDVCSSCAAACKPHAGHHAECKACFEACAATIAEAKTHMG